MKIKRTRRIKKLIESLDTYSTTSAADKTVIFNPKEYDELYNTMNTASPYSKSFVFHGQTNITIMRGIDTSLTD